MKNIQENLRIIPGNQGFRQIADRVGGPLGDKGPLVFPHFLRRTRRQQPGQRLRQTVQLSPHGNAHMMPGKKLQIPVLTAGNRRT